MSKTNDATIDVLIVGAGPTGLMLAHLLSLWKISCRIVDSNSGPAKESRALGIQARTLELMQSLGLIDSFLQKGVKVQGLQMHLKGKKRLSIDLSDMSRPDTPFPFIFILSQRETELILLEALRNDSIEVERKHSLVAFTESSDLISAEVEDASGHKEILRARYLIGCDGAHSRVRELLGLAFRGASYASEFLLADAKVQGDIALDRLSIFLEDGAVGVLFPMQGNQLSRILTVRLYEGGEAEPASTATTSAPASLPEIQQTFNRISHKNLQLMDPEWVTKYHVHHRSVQQLQVGRAFLAGDASHIHSPVGAQGMNTGLQDAANLAWKLALTIKHQANSSLLSTYQSERWPIGQHLLKFTDRVFEIAITKNKTVLFLRDLLLPTLTKILSLSAKGKRLLFGFVSELNIHYHQSSAVSQNLIGKSSDNFENSLQAGHRAPNASLKKGLDLFDLLKGYQFHLLLISRKAFSSGRIEAIRQSWAQSSKFPAFPLQEHWISAKKSDMDYVHTVATQEVFERFGIQNEGLYLIRPDGYIGFRSDDFERAFQTKAVL